MIEDKIVNNSGDSDEINIEEVLDACARRIKNSEGKEDSEEGVKVFLKYFNSEKKLLDINKPLQGKWTALAFATYFGKAKEIATLIDLGAKPNIELEKKMNVLHMAATEGKEDLCLYFIKHGVDIDSQCENGMTALMRACEAGHFHVVKALMPHHPNLKIIDKSGKSGIDYCRESKSFEIIRYINNYCLNQELRVKSPDEAPVKKVSKI